MGRIEDSIERLGFGWAACFLSFYFSWWKGVFAGVFEKDGVFMTVFCGHNTVVKCLIVVVSGRVFGV
jgi:hypothetical protein